MLRGREDEVGDLRGDQLREYWSSGLTRNTATGLLMDTDTSDEEPTGTN